ncbi:hypothetical protein [Neisseria leonii]|uniref:hypothetical protein n=1 Tax=Neisseria leonii TaxID=2995413 RepID=UPI00237A6E26|nr:hypothetical protein [Neisseria sp. 3986]MDD9324722.1 hypothetical protein [Neisseria sp. 3986]
MKKFDLTAALNGKAVRLQNGNKAFVKFNIPNSDFLVGYYENDDNFLVCTWIKGGLNSAGKEDLNIVGMYPETVLIGEIKVPMPEQEPLENGTIYFLPNLESFRFPKEKLWGEFTQDDHDYLKANLIHTSRHAAVVHAQALIEITGGKMFYG